MKAGVSSKYHKLLVSLNKLNIASLDNMMSKVKKFSKVKASKS